MKRSRPPCFELNRLLLKKANQFVCLLRLGGVRDFGRLNSGERENWMRVGSGRVDSVFKQLRG